MTTPAAKDANDRFAVAFRMGSARRGRLSGTNMETDSDSSARSARRLLLHFLLLTAAVALVAYGLAAWQYEAFTLDGVLLYDNGWRPHPLHFLVVGIAMTPPAMWEIFALEVRSASHRANAARQAE